MNNSSLGQSLFSLVVVLFLLSGGCTLHVSVDCLITDWCDPLVSIFYLPGIFFCFLFVRLMAKTVSQSRNVGRLAIHFLGAAQLVTIIVLLYTNAEVITSLYNYFVLESFCIIASYFAFLVYCAYHSLIMAYKCVVERHKSIPSKIKMVCVYLDTARSYSMALFIIYFFFSCRYFIYLNTRSSYPEYNIEYIYGGFISRQYEDMIPWAVLPVMCFFLMTIVFTYLWKRCLGVHKHLIQNKKREPKICKNPYAVLDEHKIK